MRLIVKATGALLACVFAIQVRAQTPQPRPWNVILVTIDGLRWQELFGGAQEHLAKRKPRVLYVQLGETDEWAHMRRYDCYLEAAHNSDRFLRKLWETAQSLPGHAGRTSLVLTTDHGRGGTLGDWTNHGKDVEGAEHVWMAVFGPDVPALGVRENVNVTLGQVASTVASLAGEDYHAEVPQAAPPLPTKR